jgi:hypothetical protein
LEIAKHFLKQQIMTHEKKLSRNSIIEINEKKDIPKKDSLFSKFKKAVSYFFTKGN